MRLAALYSGGKDSTLALYLAEQMGHSVEHLVNIAPADPHSWLFHTPNLHLLPLMAESMGKTLVTVPSSGDEEDDLRALREALERLDVEGVVTGAVASDYQWDRINGVCHELGFKCINPLWRKHPHQVMQEVLSSGLKAIVVGVSAEGLDESWLGRPLDESAVQDLLKLEEKYSVNVAGEGGEYESLTLDSPLHRFPIVVDSCKVAMSQLSGLMRVTAFHAGVREDP